MRIGVGRAVFATTLIALGLFGLITGGFAPIWEPVPSSWPARGALAYLCALVALASGAGLLWRRTAVQAASVLFLYLLLWMLVFKAPAIVAAPAVAASWESCGETAVLVAAAWALLAGFALDPQPRRFRLATGERGARMAKGLYGLALIAFGVAHLAYVKATAALVPGWLPAHAAWTYFTGFAYIAAGAAILVGICPKLAAALSALQMGGFTLLVWAPAMASGRADASQWSEGVISWTLTAAAWVVADSYRGLPWLASGRRHGAT